MSNAYKETPVLSLSKITKGYNRGRPGEIEVLREADLDLMAGEVVALMAPSGSGKSTLLHLAGLLDTPDSGSITICGEDYTAAGDRVRTQARALRIGFVYQAHHLLGEFTALENVALPQLVIGRSTREANHRSQELLERVGLGHRARHRPSDMSGGEQQRVAICRALACNPSLLIADEPTGNLDRARSQDMLSMLLEIAAQERIGALVATHDFDLAKGLSRIVCLEEGRIST
jgi:lipoprotein-releasing system ATP-binding protein